MGPFLMGSNTVSSMEGNGGFSGDLGFGAETVVDDVPSSQDQTLTQKTSACLPSVEDPRPWGLIFLIFFEEARSPP